MVWCGPKPTFPTQMVWCGPPPGLAGVSDRQCESEFGALAVAGLDEAYGCVDFDECPDTTMVKYVSYADDDGFVTEHRYESGERPCPRLRWRLRTRGCLAFWLRSRVVRLRASIQAMMIVPVALFRYSSSLLRMRIRMRTPMRIRMRTPTMWMRTDTDVDADGRRRRCGCGQRHR